jgi:hypothetical protein
MPTLHRTIEAASKEAKELLSRYNVKHAYVVQHNRVYDLESNLDAPGFEALIGNDLPVCPNIVATINWGS